jgi:hypothetical protein
MRPIESNKHFITTGAIILWLYLRPLMKLFPEQNYVAQFSNFYANLELTIEVHDSPRRVAASIVLA